MNGRALGAGAGCLAAIALGLWTLNPALALLGAAAVRLGFDADPLPDSPRLSRLCLQSAIVLLGLTMSIEQVATVSADYGIAVAVFVTGTLGSGVGLAWLLRIRSTTTDLLTSGTAICGGTAIATLSPVLGARPEQVGIALTLVFLLNALALLSFPGFGAWLGLSQAEFGAWVALAIHDTSSVVATAALYGDEALEVATTVKLGRTLWLVPLTLAASLAVRSRGARLRVPLFVVLFVAAAGLASLVPLPPTFLALCKLASKVLLVLALGLVGLGISRDILRSLSPGSVAFGVGLWGLAVVAALQLAVLGTAAYP